VLAGLVWAIGLVLTPNSAGSALIGYLVNTNLLLGLFNMGAGIPAGRWTRTGIDTHPTVPAPHRMHTH